jgi:hypothetical protein
VIAVADRSRAFATRAAFRRHGTVDVDLCPGSEQAPPVPPRPRGGWRVQIATRDDGVIQAQLCIGSYDERLAEADEQWLRFGRYRDKHWPSMVGAAARYIEYLSPEDVAYIQELEAGQLDLAREMDAVHAELSAEARR